MAGKEKRRGRKEGDRETTFHAPSRFAFRTPLLPLSRFTEWAADPALPALRARLAQLIDAPETADAIFVASPDLHSSLEAWRRAPDSPRGQRVERSLVRYFSRMTSRPTPFGLFAAVSTGRFAVAGVSTAVTLPALESYRRSTRIDNDYLFALCEAAALDPAVREALLVRPNSSLYEAAGRLRYAESRLEGKARSYHLIAVEPSDYLLATLQRAADGARIEELARGLVDGDPDVEIGEARAFIIELIDSQLLVSDLSPNVTGPEPIHHCVRRLREAGAVGIAEPLSAAQAAIEEIDAAGLGASPESYLAIAATLEGLPAPVEIGRLFQVDMVAPPVEATLPARVLREVERAIATLERITHRADATPLSRFREAFAARYESREVPLSIALDEEVGVGFDSSETPGAEAAPLLAGLPFPGAPTGGASLRWFPRDDHLLELLTTAAARGEQAIELDARDIEKLSAARPERLADAISLMTTVVARSAEAVDRGEFRILLESAHGPSGARLLGRFCIASDEHDELVREHLRAEQALVPGAVFAEIAHLPEGRIGNVLCRPVLRDYEIPFLGVSGADGDKQLPVSDLTVSVRGDRVILRSIKLGCEVVPRLSTAHNVGQRSLGVYRFLCSLQGQGTGGVAWSWGPFASASSLPRVSVGRHVLARARWRLGEADIAPLAAASKGAKKASAPAEIRAIRERVVAAAAVLREARGLPRFVVLADGDNELPVDFENPLSVDSFVALIRARPEAQLTELYPGPDELFVAGPEGAYVHQIVIPLIRAEEPRPSRGRALPVPGSDRLPLGSEWLYAKIYTGTSTADDVLAETVWPIAKAALASGDADKWFFLRYGDPNWHLRVRFYGAPERLRATVLPELSRAAGELCGAGLAWKFQLDTYERETARYGGEAGIELAEELFSADSDAVCEIVELLEGDEGAVARWQLCLRGIDMIFDDLGFDLDAKRELITSARQSFGDEFSADTKLARALGKRFRSESDELIAILARDPRIDADHPFEPGFASLAKRSSRQRAVGVALRARREHLTCDIGDIALSVIHMHANRLLRSAQRAHELVLYDFLKRYYEMRIHRR